MTDRSSNLGTRRLPPLPVARFPDAGAAVQKLTAPARPAGAVEGAIHAPSTPQTGIGGIDDSLGVLPGDVALDQFETRRTDPDLCEHGASKVLAVSGQLQAIYHCKW
jgi:hypothetical protein